MFDYLLIKLSSRCNLDCSYCYWFRDPSVRTLPAILGESVVEALLPRLRSHIRKHGLARFVCSFHGGEPLLFGRRRFDDLAARLTRLGEEEGCVISHAITTNGVLITSEWAEVLAKHHVSVAVSIDGPPEVHDARRLTIKGGVTWERAVDGYLELCRAGIAPSIIAVCDPKSDAKATLRHFVEDLGTRFCDVLIPDANHEDVPESIARFYIELFDVWFHEYHHRGIEVRILKDMLRGLLGLQTTTDSIGFAPVRTVCLNPAGQLEPHDVLRIAGSEHVSTNVNVFDAELDAIMNDPRWLAVRDASLTLCGACLSCRYQKACGGGHIAQRWSALSGYANPSVYCEDLQQIFDHIASRIAPRIVEINGLESASERSILSHLLRGQSEFIHG